MSQKNVIPLQSGKCYHIFNRGVAKLPIFLKEENYDYFLKLYEKHIRPVAHTFAYCLMNNHFHILLQIKHEEDLSKSFQNSAKSLSVPFANFFNAYTQGLNKAHDREGGLFERPFKRVLIESEEQLIQTILYIHGNPQKDGFIKDFRDYPFSSYRAVESGYSNFLEVKSVVNWFEGKKGFVEHHEGYRDNLDRVLNPVEVDKPNPVEVSKPSPVKVLAHSVTDLLKSLIATPSFSRDEGKTADLIATFLSKNEVQPYRNGHNIWAIAPGHDPDRPTILLNSHHDTVKPAKGWERDPFRPQVDAEGKLFGLGSNDAGGPLMALLASFLILKDKPRSHNLIFAATAEEEISGPNGIAAILPQLEGQYGPISLGVIGEPTQMQMAVAEKGLMVLDCEAAGKSGHAARNEGVNAIYQALPDIQWFNSYQFPTVSEMLGPVKMTVTQINSGTQHNVVPASCTFVVDVRTNEHYPNKVAYELIQEHVACQVTPRSFRLNSSGISMDHPVVQRGTSLGLSAYGSPTLSDQALCHFPTLKIGPGDSARSHTPDEYIYLTEIEKGIEGYLALLDGLTLE